MTMDESPEVRKMASSPSPMISNFTSSVRLCRDGERVDGRSTFLCSDVAGVEHNGALS
jgi:hypothetical protein